MDATTERKSDTLKTSENDPKPHVHHFETKQRQSLRLQRPREAAVRCGKERPLLCIRGQNLRTYLRAQRLPRCHRRCSSANLMGFNSVIGVRLACNKLYVFSTFPYFCSGCFYLFHFYQLKFIVFVRVHSVLCSSMSFDKCFNNVKCPPLLCCTQ